MTPEENEVKVRTVIAVTRLLMVLEIKNAKEEGGLDPTIADDPNFLNGAIFGAIIAKQRIEEYEKKRHDLQSSINEILKVLEKEIEKEAKKN
jgi:hypothetical protein